MKILITLTFVIISSSLYAAERLPIIKVGHPTLRAVAQEVSLATFQDPNFQKLVDDMIHTMSVAGGVGLAAPQINQSIRMFVMKSGSSVPLAVVINPVIDYVEEEGKRKYVEGCLSIPGKAVKVNRFKKIRMSYFDRHGQYISTELTGFGAIIAQHEYDHLNGILIIDLIEQMNEIINYNGFTSAPLM
jgi:peptide deformylase